MPADEPVGILGGTFDPVHCGHVRIAVEAHEALGLDHVRLVPLNTPGHRPPPVAPVEARVEMLRTIADDVLRVDLREIERGGVSYTVDTLRSFRDDWPARPLCLLIGLDAYLSLPSWHRAGELLGLAHVVVAARPGVHAEALAGLDELVGNAQSDRVADLRESSCGRIFFLELPLLPIASSDLRDRCRERRDIRSLVPDAVREIITRRRLYAS